MSKVLASFVLFLIFLASPLSGQIVEDTNITASSSLGSFNLTVFQTPDSGINGDFTGVLGSITVTGSTAMLVFEGSGVDEGSDWFAADPGDLLTRDTIDSGQFNTLIDSAQMGALTVDVDQSFFLGVNTGVDPINFSPLRQHFGWGEFLINQNGELQILDSAVAYDQVGIVVGENVAVPEPSSGLLMLAGAAFLFLRRSRCSGIHRLNVQV